MRRRSNVACTVLREHLPAEGECTSHCQCRADSTEFCHGFHLRLLLPVASLDQTLAPESSGRSQPRNTPTGRRPAGLNLMQTDVPWKHQRKINPLTHDDRTCLGLTRLSLRYRQTGVPTNSARAHEITAWNQRVAPAERNRAGVKKADIWYGWTGVPAPPRSAQDHPYPGASSQPWNRPRRGSYPASLDAPLQTRRPFSASMARAARTPSRNRSQWRARSAKMTSMA